jgi:hypothetical protein
MVRVELPWRPRFSGPVLCAYKIPTAAYRSLSVAVTGRSTPERRQCWAGDKVGTVAEILEPLPGLEHEVMPESGGTPTREILDRYDVVMAFAYPFPGESLKGVKRLCCIARWGVGFDSVDVDACTDADVVALSPVGESTK